MLTEFFEHSAFQISKVSCSGSAVLSHVLGLDYVLFMGAEPDVARALLDGAADSESLRVTPPVAESVHERMLDDGLQSVC